MKQSLWNGIFWHHLIYPEFSGHEVEDPALSVASMHEVLLPGKYPDFVVCLALDDLDRLSSDERKEVLESVRRCISRTMPASQRLLLGFAHGNSAYFCGTLRTGDDPGRQEIIHKLESLLTVIRNRTAQPATAGLAFLTDHTIDAWRVATQHAVVAQRNRVRSGSGRLYIADADFPTFMSDRSSFWRLSDRLYGLVRSGDLDAVTNAINNVLCVVFTEHYLALGHLRPILQSQIVLMAQAAMEVGVDAAAITPRSEYYLEQLGSVYDYVRMKELIHEAASEFTTAVHERHRFQSSRLVALADEYILAHLADSDLGLHEMAVALNANPSYLSRCYKKEKGRGIVESINYHRIEQAKLLLLDKRISITDIAFQLGFGSVQHFGRVFRNLEHCAPSDFRRKKSS